MRDCQTDIARSRLVLVQIRCGQALLIALITGVLIARPRADIPPPSFTPGNPVIYRIGTGTGSLVNTGNAVFLDEFTPAGALVQSIALPTSANGINQPLIASGTATSEGLLTRSTDGRYLVLTGYGTTAGGSSLSGTTGTAVPRTVGLVDAFGIVNTSTALSDFASGNNPRSAASTNGSDLWVAGGAGGARYTTAGSTTSIALSATVTNLRALQIFGGQLYTSDSAGGAVRLGTVGTGLPTTSGQTIANLPGFPLAGSPYAFFFADLDGSPGPDTLYVADDTNGSPGGITKYSLVAGNWVSNGTVGAASDSYRGLTGTVSGATVTLYATRNGGAGATGGGELVKWVDAGGYNAAFSGAPTLLATAAAHTAFRGVALAPEAPPLAGSVPVPGDIIFNEYASDNDANGNDFFELLVLRDNLDLRGLRVSDNEATSSGVLNNNESVFVFGQDAFLKNVPQGTLIAVYTSAAGVTTDTVVNAAANDWKMVLAPGTGVTASIDGLGGSLSAGLATGGDALYLYLPGPDGTSAGSDNVYLDFISWEGGANGPPGLVSLDLPSPADNAYYIGHTAEGNDLAANWVRYDGAPIAGTTTPGDPNPGQDLSSLRTASNTPHVILTESGGSTNVTEGGGSDRYTIQLSTMPLGPVQIQATSGPQTEVSADNGTFGSTATIVLSGASPATLYVRAIDDAIVEGPMTASITHTIVASGDPLYSNALTPAPSVTVFITDNDIILAPIASIQGPGSTSPLVGTAVTTRGIVTGLKSNGFYIQEPDATTDGDPSTSEGIFVFTSSTPTVRPGDFVQVSATVSEFIPSADPHQPPVTELDRPSIAVLSSDNPLPAPVEITAAMTTAPNVLQLLESLEGMRVMVRSLTVVGPTLVGTSNEAAATSTTSGVFYGVVSGVARPFREPGIDINDPLPPGSPCCIPRFDGNPERLRIDSDAQPGTLPLDLTSGVTVTGIVGPLDYSFRTYTILPDPGSATVTTPNAVFTPAAVAGPDEIVVAGFNMERFFDTVNDPAVDDVALTAAAFEKRLSKASLTFRNVLLLPDVVGVTEMENLSTLQTIASRINADTTAAGGANPAYTAYLVEGNDIGGIDVGFLVKSGRVAVLNVRQEGKDATFVDPTDGSVDLLNDRPPLVLDAQAIRPNGSVFDFTVVINHLRSLSGVDDSVDGPRVRAKRRAQAEYLASLIQGLQTANPSARVMSIGDYNAFDVNDGYVDSIGTIRGEPASATEVALASPDLVNPNLTNLVSWLPAPQRYSYVFDGNAQVLDHALVNTALLPWVSRFGYTRSNADFPDTARNDGTRPERLSDHDASVTYLAIGTPKLSSRLLSQTPRSAGQMSITVQIANLGGGNARGVVVERTLLKTLRGIGTVTPATPTPIAVGDIAAGQSVNVTLTLNVPVGVVRFSVTEDGAYADSGATNYRFSTGLPVAP